MIARTTLNGFYQYDSTLLDTITLPQQYNKQIMVDELLHMCGDLYTYIQQPTFLKRNIHNWFLRNYENFERMAEAFYSEYNPIENYNRYENWKDIPDLTVVTDVDNTTTNNLKTETKNDNTEEQTSAFDSDTYQPKSKTLHGAEIDNTGTVTDKGKNTQTTNGNTEHDGRIHGNIGVTTSQQMINAELELRENDLYSIIRSKFEDEFIVRVY